MSNIIATGMDKDNLRYLLLVNKCMSIKRVFTVLVKILIRISKDTCTLQCCHNSRILVSDTNATGMNKDSMNKDSLYR